jgi:hypothetical protein
VPSGSRARRPDPAPCPAGQLPGGLGRAAEHRGDLAEGNVEHVVQHERDPLGRGQRLEDHEQREPDGVGEQRLLLRRRPVRRAEHRVRHARPDRVSGRAARARSAFRQTRVTMVVSQPPRLTTSSAPAALNLTHASCTASSASSSEPSIR